MVIITFCRLSFFQTIPKDLNMEVNIKFLLPIKHFTEPCQGQVGDLVIVSTNCPHTCKGIPINWLVSTPLEKQTPIIQTSLFTRATRLFKGFFYLSLLIFNLFIQFFHIFTRAPHMFISFFYFLNGYTV